MTYDSVRLPLSCCSFAISLLVARNRKHRMDIKQNGKIGGWRKKSCYFVKSNIVKSKQFCNSMRLLHSTEKELRCVFFSSAWYSLVCNLIRLSHTHSHSSNTLAMNKVKTEREKESVLYLSTTFAWTTSPSLAPLLLSLAFFALAIYFSHCLLDFYVQIWIFFFFSTCSTWLFFSHRIVFIRMK